MQCEQERSLGSRNVHVHTSLCGFRCVVISLHGAGIRSLELASRITPLITVPFSESITEFLKKEEDKRSLALYNEE